MRRTPLTRKTRLAGTGRMSRHNCLAKANAKRIARRRASYDAYMKSPEWKARRKGCLRRAGFRCEYVVDGRRCPERTGLEAHHLTYRRWMRELPADLQCLCSAHHHRIESELRPWNKHRRKSA